jgi:hypothetical protein
VPLDVLGLLAHLIVQVLLDERLDRAGAGASPGLRDRLLALLADDTGRDLTVVRLLLDAALPVGLVGRDGVRAGRAARLVRVRDGDAHARGRPRPRGARGVVGVRDRDRVLGAGFAFARGVAFAFRGLRPPPVTVSIAGIGSPPPSALMSASIILSRYACASLMAMRGSRSVASCRALPRIPSRRVASAYASASAPPALRAASAMRRSRDTASASSRACRASARRCAR